MNNVVGEFAGTIRESYDLQAAIAHNCACAHNPPEPTDPLCPAHDLLRDVRVLGHLIFARRWIETYRFHEWNVEDHDD